MSETKDGDDIISLCTFRRIVQYKNIGNDIMRAKSMKMKENYLARKELHSIFLTQGFRRINKFWIFQKNKKYERDKSRNRH